MTTFTQAIAFDGMSSGERTRLFVPWSRRLALGLTNIDQMREACRGGALMALKRGLSEANEIRIDFDVIQIVVGGYTIQDRLEHIWEARSDRRLE